MRHSKYVEKKENTRTTRPCRNKSALYISFSWSQEARKKTDNKMQKKGLLVDVSWSPSEVQATVRHETFSAVPASISFVEHSKKIYWENFSRCEEPLL